MFVVHDVHTLFGCGCGQSSSTQTHTRIKQKINCTFVPFSSVSTLPLLRGKGRSCCQIRVMQLFWCLLFFLLVHFGDGQQKRQTESACMNSPFEMIDIFVWNELMCVPVPVSCICVKFEHGPES